MLQPVECCSDVLTLTSSMVVCPFAQSRSAEVEAQDGQPEAVQRFDGVIDDLVVHRSTMHRMRVANQCGVWRARLPSVEQCFQPSGRARKEQ